jgi:hypothetical protein
VRADTPPRARTAIARAGVRVTVEPAVKGLLLIAVAAGLAGCVHGQTVIAPDGHPATIVTCHDQYKCFIKAERLCPWGYQVLDERLGTLLFRCPYPAAPPLPPQPQPQPPPGPNPTLPNAPTAPAAPGTAPGQPAEKLYHT